MSRVILAVDPGLTGACAMFDALTGEVIGLHDLPVVRDQSLAWIDSAEWYSMVAVIAHGRQLAGIVERVSPNPKNGGQALYSQGLTLGSVLAALTTMAASVEFVAPQTWKRSHGLIFDKDVGQTKRKHASLDKARLAFPNAELDRAKDHGRAEALLIGAWYLRHRNLSRAAA